MQQPVPSGVLWHPPRSALPFLRASDLTSGSINHQTSSSARRGRVCLCRTVQVSLPPRSDFLKNAKWERALWQKRGETGTCTAARLPASSGTDGGRRDRREMFHSGPAVSANEPSRAKHCASRGDFFLAPSAKGKKDILRGIITHAFYLYSLSYSAPQRQQMLLVARTAVASAVSMRPP